MRIQKVSIPKVVTIISAFVISFLPSSLPAQLSPSQLNPGTLPPLCSSFTGSASNLVQSVNGTITEQPSFTNPTANVTLSGVVNAGPMTVTVTCPDGPVTLNGTLTVTFDVVMEYSVTNPWTAGTINGTWELDNGDDGKIQGTTTGTVAVVLNGFNPPYPPTSADYTAATNITITGGTGNFEKAVGSGTFTTFGNVDLTGGGLNGFSLNLNPNNTQDRSFNFSQAGLLNKLIYIPLVIIP